MDYSLFTLDDRPDLIGEVAQLHRAGWPPFMQHDPMADAYWPALTEYFADVQLALCDAAGKVVASAHTIPVQWDGTVAGLPAGWDAVLEKGVQGRWQGHSPTTLSALAVVIAPTLRAQGLSEVMVRAMKELAAIYGFNALIAPVRPAQKSLYPLTPMERYVRWTRSDGLPHDNWLRVHTRLGASVLAIAPRSMVIPAPIADWQAWTGLIFPESGAYVVPGALQPIQVNCEADVARYEEPNVWMCHPVTDATLDGGAG